MEIKYILTEKERAFLKARSWWNSLSKEQQSSYNMIVFGEGEFWEDNSLHEKDIIKIYEHHQNENKI